MTHFLFSYKRSQIFPFLFDRMCGNKHLIESMWWRCDGEGGNGGLVGVKQPSPLNGRYTEFLFSRSWVDIWLTFIFQSICGYITSETSGCNTSSIFLKKSHEKYLLLANFLRGLKSINISITSHTRTLPLLGASFKEMAKTEKPPLPIQPFPLWLLNPSSSTKAFFIHVLPYPINLSPKSLTSIQTLSLSDIIFVFTKSLSPFFHYNQTILVCSFKPFSPIHTSLHLHMYPCHISQK